MRNSAGSMQQNFKIHPAGVSQLVQLIYWLNELLRPCPFSSECQVVLEGWHRCSFSPLSVSSLFSSTSFSCKRRVSHDMITTDSYKSDLTNAGVWEDRTPQITSHHIWKCVATGSCSSFLRNFIFLVIISRFIACCSECQTTLSLIMSQFFSILYQQRQDVMLSLALRVTTNSNLCMNLDEIWPLVSSKDEILKFVHDPDHFVYLLQTLT